MVAWSISIPLLCAVVSAQLPQQNLQFPNWLPVTTLGNPNALQNLFPWLNNNNNINQAPGVSTNSFLPWTPGNGPISRPITQALQAMQAPLQAFTGLFRPQNLNNLPGLGVFQQPATGPTLQNLKPQTQQQESEESDLDIFPGLSHFPAANPGEVNTPGSDLIAELFEDERAENVAKEATTTAT